MDQNFGPTDERLKRCDKQYCCRELAVEGGTCSQTLGGGREDEKPLKCEEQQQNQSDIPSFRLIW